MIGDKPHCWFYSLPLLKFWCNTSNHTSIEMSSFEVLYGYPPPIHISYFHKDSKIKLLDNVLTMRIETL